MRRISAFAKLTWAAGGLVSVAVILLIQVYVHHKLKPFPSSPNFPWPGISYISAYRDSETDHYLFRFGLFGFGERIRRSDILIVGSSHPQLGISAKQIALYESASRKVENRIFNMGEGYGENLAFAQEILAANRVCCKLILLDLFAPHGASVSSYAETVRQSGIIVAYRNVLETWFSFLRDWLMDTFLFRVRITLSGSLQFERALGNTVLRDWQNGDTLEIWNPRFGSHYDHPDKNNTHELLAASIKSNEIFVNSSTLRILMEQRFEIISTLIPYPEFDSEMAADISRQLNIPFIPISPHGLEYYDRDHLTKAGKQLATERLLEQLSSQPSFKLFFETSK